MEFDQRCAKLAMRMSPWSVATAARFGGLCLLLVGLMGTPGMAGPPSDVTNFQNEYRCSTDLRIVRPRTVQDVQDAVVLHDHVMAVGEGHSWNAPFFCASLPNATGEFNAKGKDVDSVNAGSRGRGLLTSSSRDAFLRSTRRQLLQDFKAEIGTQQTSANIAMTAVRPLAIVVDEDEESAWIDAGIKIIDVLDYLGNYVTKTAPRGWTLATFPAFLYQSIGGAVATGTHGSSLEHGSLSNQVLAMRVVLANGTLAEISPESHPFLMKAFRVSVGRLGVITSLKFRIVREQPAMRTVTAIAPSHFIEMLRSAQDMFNEEGILPEWMNETMIFWFVQEQVIAPMTILHSDHPDPAIRDLITRSVQSENTSLVDADASLAADMSSEQQTSSGERERTFINGMPKNAYDKLKELNLTRINVPLLGKAAIRSDDPDDPLGVAKGRIWEQPKRKSPNSELMDVTTEDAEMFFPNITTESHLVYPTIPEELLSSLIQETLYDQYEVAVPVDRMADCFEGLMNLVYDGDLDGMDEERRAVDKGFRTPAAFRFVSIEDGLLSPTNDCPRAYLNVEDYLYFNQGEMRNERFFKVMAFLRGSPLCSSRLHWGKAGWPDEGCWNGAEEYPDTWCDFGCAVMALDPSGKFIDTASDRWNWEGANLDACCTESGYDRSRYGCTCSVIPVKNVEDCPPPPFYTTR